MNFPPPPHSTQSSIASNSDKSSTASRLSRSQQSVWGAPQQHQGSRRGLTPLSTSDISAVGSGLRRSTASSSPGPQSSTQSPLTSSFSAVVGSSNRLVGSRANSTASQSASPFTPLQAGSLQAQFYHSNQNTSSSRPRANTPGSTSHLASGNISVNTAQGGGGVAGGGGGTSGASRSATYSPALSSTIGSPTGSTFDKGAIGPSSAGGSGSSGSSLSKISIAQVLLLLDTINEKEGKTKWDSKAEQIRKLVESNGMDVFSKYFRRLVSGNAAQIFPGSNLKNDGNSGNYPLLVEEIQKVLQDPSQAPKIVETVDTSDGDVFRDFDLATFVKHFRLDPLAETILALAFTQSSRPDLRYKANAVFNTTFPSCLQGLSFPRDSNRDVNPAVLAYFIEKFATNPGPNQTDENRLRLESAIVHRFEQTGNEVPENITSALQILRLSSNTTSLLRQISRLGPKSTMSLEAMDEILAGVDQQKLDPADVSSALLFMVFSSERPSYNLSNFVGAIRARFKLLDWRAVVEGFDQVGMGSSGLQIDSQQLAAIINALLPIAREEERVDLQMLWGGKWQNTDTQLSFLKAFLLSQPGQIDISQIPRFRPSFSLELFQGASENIIAHAERVVKSTFNSLAAVTAVFEVVLESNASDITVILEHDLATFLVSAARIPGEWTPIQTAAMRHSFNMFLMKTNDSYTFALEGAWRQNQVFVISSLVEAFSRDPMQTEPILNLAQELGWTDELLTLNSPFAMDLACLLHKRDAIDFEDWLRKFAERQGDIGTFLMKYLRIKADDEIRVQRREQMAPRSVSLAVKTVFNLLLTAEDYVSDEELLMPMQRMCLATYPRLVNFGEGFDEIIEANGVNGNALSEETDKQMQDLFGKMYREEAPIREILELMRRYKTSQDPAEQDLFTCIVHGLFDEYHCYHEYPADALIKTAVMFGGIINFKLISGIPMKVGLGLILDAVRDHEPHESMYKFGVEAIEQLTSRLPEWVGFCNILTQIPTLADTAIAQRAAEIVGEQGHGQPMQPVTNGVHGRTAFDLPNGTAEMPTAQQGALRSFRSVHVSPPRGDRYVDPPEDVQDKVLFLINNISQDNFDEKVKDLQVFLQQEYYQWFAAYLVEQRAKLEPNYQPLYLDVLDVINNKELFEEVLRETYGSSIRMINAESTVTSSTERGLLRNLGSWLGSLTIARDKPIKHKNIYFKELLIEGWQTQRLVVVLPFTCKVLLRATHSKVFKPPNPWLMDIVGLLLELYHKDIKLNLKFEVEVLCKDLELDLKALQPSTCIKEIEEQALQVEEDLPPSLQDYPDLEDEIAINGVARNLRGERLSPATLMSNLPNLETVLTYPTLNNAIDPAFTKEIITAAFQRAIAEIIGPVVERSITIASISTAQSVAKDFAMEADEEKLRSAARQMVKSLAGSLALVTCKEPLRMSITNYIRRPPEQTEHEYFLPEGVIMMTLNDNLDKACSLIEKAAEEKSIPEIDRVIESQVEARRRHKATQGNAPFLDQNNFNRWSLFIPEPFRQNQNGLNEQQLAVYKDFAPQARGSGPNHVPNVSTDSSGRQMPDVLQEPFATMPNLSTPAEQPVMPHQTPLPPQESRLQPPISASAQTPHMNGYMDTTNPQEKITNLLGELQKTCQDLSVDHVKEVPRDNSIFSIFHQILHTLTTSTRPNGEILARFVAERICTSIFSEIESNLEIEVMAHLLAKICSLSEIVSRDVFRWMTSQEEGHIFNIPVTIALIDAGLIEFSRVDAFLTKAIVQRKVQALHLLSDLMDHSLFNEEPTALRADFSSTLDAMNAWLAEDPDLTMAAEINNKLRATGVPETVKSVLSDAEQAKHDQMEYIFGEWIGLYQNPSASERMYATFMKDLHQKQTINNQEDSALFLRLCIDSCVNSFDQEAQHPMASLSDAYLETDGLAKLIILLIKLQGESNGAVKTKKAAYLKSMLSLIVLVENHHQIMRGDRFNQRVFYRLFSSILCEYTINGLHHSNEHRDMMMAFAEIFVALQPLYIPGFAYGWLSLLSHRVFMPGVLNLGDEAGWEIYSQLIQIMLRYICEQLKPAQITPVSQDMYRGCLRILLILHHDFPEFVAENHYHFSTIIPAHCTQLRNLILSAYPSSLQELPDPFAGGLKVDRLAEMSKSPRIAGNLSEPIEQAGVKALLDNALHGQSNIDDAVTQIVEAISTPKTKDTGVLYEPINVNIVLVNALVVYIAQDAIVRSNSKALKKDEAEIFDRTSPHATLLEKACKVLDAGGRYQLINAIANQLRYPNSHTHFCCYAMLHLFGMDHIDQQETDIRQQIVRVILERLIVHRPHPWGLLIVLLELDRNTSYRFWDLPFIAAAPEIKRLFHSLSSHIHQPSSRPLA